MLAHWVGIVLLALLRAGYHFQGCEAFNQVLSSRYRGLSVSRKRVALESKPLGSGVLSSLHRIRSSRRANYTPVVRITHHPLLSPLHAVVGLVGPQDDDETSSESIDHSNSNASRQYYGVLTANNGSNITADLKGGSEINTDEIVSFVSSLSNWANSAFSASRSFLSRSSSVESGESDMKIISGSAARYVLNSIERISNSRNNFQVNNSSSIVNVKQSQYFPADGSNSNSASAVSTSTLEIIQEMRRRRAQRNRMKLPFLHHHHRHHQQQQHRPHNQDNHHDPPQAQQQQQQQRAYNDEVVVKYHSFHSIGTENRHYVSTVSAPPLGMTDSASTSDRITLRIKEILLSSLSGVSSSERVAKIVSEALRINSSTAADRFLLLETDTATMANMNITTSSTSSTSSITENHEGKRDSMLAVEILKVFTATVINSTFPVQEKIITITKSKTASLGNSVWQVLQQKVVELKHRWRWLTLDRAITAKNYEDISRNKNRAKSYAAGIRGTLQRLFSAVLRTKGVQTSYDEILHLHKSSLVAGGNQLLLLTPPGTSLQQNKWLVNVQKQTITLHAINNWLHHLQQRTYDEAQTAVSERGAALPAVQVHVDLLYAYLASDTLFLASLVNILDRPLVGRSSSLYDDMYNSDHDITNKNNEACNTGAGDDVDNSSVQSGYTTEEQLWERWAQAEAVRLVHMLVRHSQTAVEIIRKKKNAKNSFPSSLLSSKEAAATVESTQVSSSKRNTDGGAQINIGKRLSLALQAIAFNCTPAECQQIRLYEDSRRQVQDQMHHQNQLRLHNKLHNKHELVSGVYSLAKNTLQYSSASRSGNSNSNSNSNRWWHRWVPAALQPQPMIPIDQFSTQDFISLLLLAFSPTSREGSDTDTSSNTSSSTISSASSTSSSSRSKSFPSAIFAHYTKKTIPFSNISVPHGSSEYSSIEISSGNTSNSSIATVALHDSSFSPTVRQLAHVAAWGLGGVLPPHLALLSSQSSRSSSRSNVAGILQPYRWTPAPLWTTTSSLPLGVIPGQQQQQQQQQQGERTRGTEEEEPRNRRRGIRILCLDGGGTKGVASIAVLKELVDNVNARATALSPLSPLSPLPSQPSSSYLSSSSPMLASAAVSMGVKQHTYNGTGTGRQPHEMFDLIVGTSTGAIIAALLGLQQYSIEETSILFEALMHEVFSVKLSRLKLLTDKARYDATRFERLLRILGEGRSMLDSNLHIGGPRVALVTTRVNTVPQVHLWRNYNYPLDDDSASSSSSGGGGRGSRGMSGRNKNDDARFSGSYNVMSETAVRCSTAAPTYFSPVSLYNKDLQLEKQRQEQLRRQHQQSEEKNSNYLSSEGYYYRYSTAAAAVLQKFRGKAGSRSSVSGDALSSSSPFSSSSSIVYGAAEEGLYVDGALVANNPAAIAIQEANALFPGIPIELVVSMGTGHNDPLSSCTVDSNAAAAAAAAAGSSPPQQQLGWDTLIGQLIASSTNTESTHRLLSHVLPSTQYFRFNAPFVRPELNNVIDNTAKEGLDELKAASVSHFYDLVHQDKERFEQLFHKLACD